MRTPSGTTFCALSRVFLTRLTTCCELESLSMMTMPATVSPLPSRETAPWRVSEPMTTSATSRT